MECLGLATKNYFAEGRTNSCKQPTNKFDVLHLMKRKYSCIISLNKYAKHLEIYKLRLNLRKRCTQSFRKIPANGADPTCVNLQNMPMLQLLISLVIFNQPYKHSKIAHLMLMFGVYSGVIGKLNITPYKQQLAKATRFLVSKQPTLSLKW